MRFGLECSSAFGSHKQCVAAELPALWYSLCLHPCSTPPAQSPLVYVTCAGRRLRAPLVKASKYPLAQEEHGSFEALWRYMYQGVEPCTSILRLLESGEWRVDGLAQPASALQLAQFVEFEVPPYLKGDVCVDMWLQLHLSRNL